MIKVYTYFLLYLCTATFFLFLLPHSVSAQQEMTREERIKILETLKESDAILEKSISGEGLQETQNYIEGFELPPLSVFMDAVIENATVKRAQSQVEQVKNQYRIEKRNWWNYFRLNANYAYGRFNTLNESSETMVDWYQSTTVGSLHTFNVGASFSVGLGDLFNPPPIEKLPLQHRAASIYPRGSDGGAETQSIGSIQQRDSPIGNHQS